MKAGDCDVEEPCDGSSAACPADDRAPAGTVCRSSRGACDAPETCDGASLQCAGDSLLPAGTECRAARSACDVAEQVCILISVFFFRRFLNAFLVVNFIVSYI